MGSHSTPGPSSQSRYSLSPNYNGQDGSAPLLQGKYFSSNAESSGLEGIQNIGGSSSQAYHSVLYESGYSSMPHPVLPNHQSQSFYPSLPSSRGVSLASNQVPALPFQTNSNHPETPNVAFTQYAYPSGWRGANGRMEQEGPEYHDPPPPQGIYGDPPLSALPESSSHTMIAGTSSSLSAESYKQLGWQDDLADLTQGRIVTAQEAPLVRERKIQRMKGKDKARKQADWSNDTQEAASAREKKAQRKRQLDKERKQVERDNSAENYEKICELLKIAMAPKNTLAHRILVGIEAMAEREKRDDDLRHRLKETEAYADYLKTELTNLSNRGSQSRIGPMS